MAAKNPRWPPRNLVFFWHFNISPRWFLAHHRGRLVIHLFNSKHFVMRCVDYSWTENTWNIRYRSKVTCSPVFSTRHWSAHLCARWQVSAPVFPATSRIGTKCVKLIPNWTNLKLLSRSVSIHFGSPNQRTETDLKKTQICPIWVLIWHNCAT